MLPVRPALAAAAAAAVASKPCPLIPPARDIPLPSATSVRDVRCSRSPAPSAPAAKKKATADTSTGRPTPSATLLPPPPKVPDEVAKKCRLCAVDFSPFNRRHHCRDCGEIFCDKCSQGRIVLTAEDNAPLVRVCDRCMAEVTQRLSIAKEAATRSATVQSHEDVTSTPLSQFLSSSGSKRKRTPRPTSMPEAERGEQSMPEVERAEQMFAGDGAEDDVGAGLDGEMGDGWSGQGYGGEDSDEFDRGYTVEGRIEPHMIDGFLHGEENRQFRSKVWEEFTKIRVGGVVTKGQCVHCNIEISAKRGAGTSAMSTHLKRCKARLNVTQVVNQLKSTVMSPEGITLKDWRFNQDVSRKELARMISVHGFPLSIVDYDGFRRFVSSLNPVFKMVSRRTITDDCSKKYQEERQVLLDVFKNAKSRVSLTMDMWTSNQTLGYMCITCHFTDDDWKMHKRILKFSFMKTPHTGVAMFNVVLKFLQEWNIEDKLFAITLDNASNNNAMMKLLKANLLEKKMLLGKGKLLHQRCAAHVLNLICKAGFQIINPIVHKVRESVKYIQGSTSRKQKFEEIIEQLSIPCRKRPKVDICTRWNSTYLMLKTSFELKRAFEWLTQQDQEYTFAPTSEEWEKARKVCELLKIFFDATVVVSGSLYPTANLHFHEIWEIRLVLEKQVPEVDAELNETIQYMQRKFRRYWKLTWLQISFPVIFDPRFKLAFVDFRLKQAFGSEAESKIEIVKKTLLELFKDYSVGQETTQAPCVRVQTNASARYADWDNHVNLNIQPTNEVPSGLEAYLSKQVIPRSDDFDILVWWKSNALEYPTLSRMARDVLVAPASSVPSESAFSLARRLISDFRSRLTPKTVEELMCLQDWFRAFGSTKFSMESIDHCLLDEINQHK